MLTKCSKCEGTTFRVQEMQPMGAAYKLMAVQCIKCSTPFGVTEFFNSGHLLKEQEKVLNEQAKRIKEMERMLQYLVQVQQQRR